MWAAAKSLGHDSLHAMHERVGIRKPREEIAHMPVEDAGEAGVATYGASREILRGEHDFWNSGSKSNGAKTTSAA